MTAYIREVVAMTQRKTCACLVTYNLLLPIIQEALDPLRLILIVPQCIAFSVTIAKLS